MDNAHLKRLEDKAVALCRTPNFKLFVFDLPDCQLLREVILPDSLLTPLEQFMLSPCFREKEDTMIFEFCDPDFFSDDKENVRYGKLLFINFKDFIKEPKNGAIQLKIDENFFCNQNESELSKVVVLSINKMAVLLDSGEVEIRQVIDSAAQNACSHKVDFIIPCPEKFSDDSTKERDARNPRDGPYLFSSGNRHYFLDYIMYIGKSFFKL